MYDLYIRRLLDRVSVISLNIAANIAANVVTAAVFIVSIPLIIPYIGLEAYGLVGFYIALQAIMSVLDFGLNVTVTREFAIGSQDGEQASDLRDLLRTAEVFYWGMAILTALCWLGVAGLLVGYINPEGLSRETIYRSILLMGIPLALQFPTSLYTSGLFGVQKQALVSGIMTTFSALRNLGVIGVLHFISPRPEAYFAWHAFCGLIHVPILAAALHAAIPKAIRRVRIRPELLTSKRRFVTGIGIITLTATLLSGVDRFVVARMLSLETFGYYSLASTVAGGIQWLIQPIFRALFPRFSQIVAQSDRSALSLIYHQGCQLMAVVVLPVAAVLILFSWETLNLWQRNAETANNTSLSMRLLVAAGAINALLFVPYALQLAFGSTRLQIFATIGGLIVSIPASIMLVSMWGAPGAASVWLTLNILLLFTTVPVAHKLLLPGATASWAVRDVAAPMAATIAGAGLARLVYQPVDSSLLTILQLGIAYALAAGCCIAASGLVREWIARRLWPSATQQST